MEKVNERRVSGYERKKEERRKEKMTPESNL